MLVRLCEQTFAVDQCLQICASYKSKLAKRATLTRFHLAVHDLHVGGQVTLVLGGFGLCFAAPLTKWCLDGAIFAFWGLTPT